MEVIRYAILWPIIVLGTLGWITKHGLWVHVGIGLAVLAVVTYAGLIFYGYLLAKPQIDADRLRRERDEADYRRIELLKRMSPPQ